MRRSKLMSTNHTDSTDQIYFPSPTLFASDAEVGRGDIYEAIDSNSVKYLHTKNIYKTPISAKAVAPMIVQWLLTNGKNRDSYLNNYPDDRDKFMSNRLCTRYKVDVQNVITHILNLDTDNFLKVRTEVLRFCNVIATNCADINFYARLFDFSLDSDYFDDQPANPTNPTNQTQNDGDTTMTNVMNSTDLYKFTDYKGVETFCTYLATDSTGKFVMEIKGTGVVVSKSADQLEIVRPFTIDVNWLSHNSTTTTYNVEGDKTLLKAGMLFYSARHAGLGIISKLNSDKKSSGTMTPDDFQLVTLTALNAVNVPTK
jgi:hypothetical protein